MSKTKQERAAQNKVYQQANQERISAYKKAYYQANATNIRAKKKAYYNTNGAHSRALSKAWRHRHPDHARNYQLRIKYGLTTVEVEMMVAAQGGRCFLCDTIPPSGQRLAVDHNHTTGQVRMMLCSACNLAIGGMREDPNLLRAAADYLESYKGIL